MRNGGNLDESIKMIIITMDIMNTESLKLREENWQMSM